MPKPPKATPMRCKVHGRATRIGFHKGTMNNLDLAKMIHKVSAGTRRPVVVALGHHGSDKQGQKFRDYGRSFCPDPSYEIPGDEDGLRRACEELGCSDALARCTIRNTGPGGSKSDHRRFVDSDLNNPDVIAIFGWCFSTDNKHFDGTFGFREDGRRDRRCIQNKKFTPGARVEYNSTSYGGWIPARVERAHSDGTISLDVRARADPNRVRAC